MLRYPPDLPWPCRAIRCLMTPPPRSASIKPFSALVTASRSSWSVNLFWRAKRSNQAFLNMRVSGLSFKIPLYSIILSVICKWFAGAFLSKSVCNCRSQRWTHPHPTGANSCECRLNQLSHPLFNFIELQREITTSKSNGLKSLNNLEYWAVRLLLQEWSTMN